MTKLLSFSRKILSIQIKYLFYTRTNIIRFIILLLFSLMLGLISPTVFLEVLEEEKYENREPTPKWQIALIILSTLGGITILVYGLYRNYICGDVITKDHPITTTTSSLDQSSAEVSDPDEFTITSPHTLNLYGFLTEISLLYKPAEGPIPLTVEAGDHIERLAAVHNVDLTNQAHVKDVCTIVGFVHKTDDTFTQTLKSRMIIHSNIQQIILKKAPLHI